MMLRYVLQSSVDLECATPMHACDFSLYKSDVHLKRILDAISLSYCNNKDLGPGVQSYTSA